MTGSNSPINLLNLEAIKEAYLREQVTGRFYPSVYVLEPISHCNLSCVMCPNSRLHIDQLGFMPLENLARILDYISPYAEHVMLYFMGEPLQHPQIIEFLELSRRILKGKISLSTNAMLLSDEIGRALIKNVDLIICCVDHWSKERYEKIRIGGNFETVVSNIENLLRLRGLSSEPKIVVKSLDFGFGKDELDDFKHHWRSRGGIPLVGWVDSWAGQFPNLRQIDYQPQPNSGLQRTHCADLWFKMVINWKGEVVLCCHNYNYSIKLGEFTDKRSLEQIWQGDRAKKLRRDHLARNYSCNRLCKGCSEWGTLKEMDVYTGLENEQLGLVF